MARASATSLSNPAEFPSAGAWRAWLARHHGRSTELTVALRRKGTSAGALTYPEALDEALCVGWIDGVRRKLDADRYTIRFTPRRKGSIWSHVNIRHAERLLAAGQMQPAGARAFAERRADRVGVYSFENRPERLPAALEQQFRAQATSWSYFSSQPSGYRRTVIWWVVSARQHATRERRLAHLIKLSRAHRRLDLTAPYSG
ncbi:MAG TPA: YdeI/OmpD-associated family protein [Opitutaceae bacterium]|nr:YdeI/OmpD-associated family protein [Opitutaceae bacterium]